MTAAPLTPLRSVDAPSPTSLGEWVPVGVWLAIVAWMGFGTMGGLDGPLWPCIALGLTPGCIWRVAFRRRAVGVFRVGFAVALMAYLVLKLKIDADHFVRLAAEWPWVLAGGALLATQPLLGAWRWHGLLRAVGISLRYREVLFLTLTGQFFNLAIPGSTGGDVVRMGLLIQRRKNTEDRWSRVIASVALDRFLGMPALFLLISLAYLPCTDWVEKHPFFLSARPMVWGATAALVGVSTLAFLYAAPLARRLSAWLRRTEIDPPSPPSRRRKTLVSLTRVLALYGDAGPTLLGGVVLGMASHTATVASLVCFARAAGLTGVPAAAQWLLAPVGLAVNAVPLMPGGLGQGEMAFAQLYEYAAPGVNNGAAGVLVMLCMRLGLLGVGCVGGCVYLTGRHRLPTDPPTEGASTPIPFSPS